MNAGERFKVKSKSTMIKNTEVEAPQGGPIHEFANDILDLHELTNE